MGYKGKREGGGKNCQRGCVGEIRGYSQGRVTEWGGGGGGEKKKTHPGILSLKEKETEFSEKERGS